LSHRQGFHVVLPLSGYFISKFIGDGLVTYAALQYPNVTFVAVYPGLVETDMLREPFRSYFDLDSPELVGGLAVWLCQRKARFLSGRFISINWSVDELEARKDEVLKDDLLKLRVRGQFGVAREL
jgi:NAD(P)-dependent dehydrogenase (short-subunit alcohol dehydrogenase family)